jgi:hypothetical protein
LLSNGHPEARLYPIGLVWDEARIVREHLNRQETTRATLLQMAVASVLSKDAAREFSRTIARINEG